MSNPTPYTDAWKERLRAALKGRGKKAELARFLAGDDPTRHNTRVVQIARVLNQGSMPESEFVLAVEAWLAGPGKKRPTGQRIANARRRDA